VFETLEKMFLEAKQDICITLSSKDLSLWLTRAIDHTLEKMAKAGTSIRIVTHIGKGDIDEIERVSRFCDIRHMEDVHYQISIVDGRKAIMGTPTSDALSRNYSDTYVSTGEKGLIETLKASFERTWEISVSAHDRIISLKREQ